MSERTTTNLYHKSFRNYQKFNPIHIVAVKPINYLDSATILPQYITSQSITLILPQIFHNLSSITLTLPQFFYNLTPANQLPQFNHNSSTILPQPINNLNSTTILPQFNNSQSITVILPQFFQKSKPSQSSTNLPQFSHKLYIAEN